MQTSDYETWKKTITGMLEYYEKSPTDTLLDVYWVGLRDWTLVEFQEAAALLVKREKFMPRVDAFERLRAEASTQTAGEVFEQVRKWLQYSPNGYTTQEGTPREIAAAIGACGGANAIAMCSLDGLPFLEKRFTEHYKQICSGAEARRSLPNLGLPAEMIGFDDEDS